MASYLPSFPYPPAGKGYWGPVTSTLNWCEEDYYATIYSAEIVNTLTNLLMVYLGYRGIASCIQNGHPRVYLVAFISLMFIGIGSMAFHGTLKYPMQLFDELAMIYFTCVLFFASFSHGRSRTTSAALLIFVIALAVFVTGYYHYIQDPVFHQVTFALLTSINVFRGMYLMETHLRPSRRSEGQAGSGAKGRTTRATQAKRDERDLTILSNMWKLLNYGLAFVAIGFFIWNLDNIFCSYLRRWRREIGLPWGILLEGHGWWHLWTGFAAYFNVVYGLWLRYCLEGRQDTVELIWPSLFTSIPSLERRPKSKTT